MSWWLYVIECRNGVLYTGITKDVDARFAAHCNGKGAKFTRANPAVAIVGTARLMTKGKALRAEYAFKQLTHRQTPLVFRRPRRLRTAHTSGPARTRYETLTVTSSASSRVARPSAPQNNMRGLFRRRRFNAVVSQRPQVDAFEQSLSTPEQDRRDGNVQLIDQALTKVLLDRAGAATNPHVLSASRLTCPIKRLANPARDEVKGRAAFHL
jgi:putative endonuclease